MTSKSTQVMTRHSLPETIKYCIQNCINYGWWTAKVDPTFLGKDCFNEAAREIGDPLNARTRKTGIELLVPATEQAAPQSSLSAAHGEKMFPLHTDGAHWPYPPRFSVMMCIINEEHRPTTLLRWRTAQELMSNDYSRERATFLVRNGAKSFYSSFHPDGIETIRYDPQCMQPANNEAEILASELNELNNSVEQEVVQWAPGILLAIDNHSVLHGRGKACYPGDRKLLRALYNEAWL
jgi:alpha-ketoglutarate-dependent taurine dioxygenase